MAAYLCNDSDCGRPAKYRTFNIDHLDNDKRTENLWCGVHGQSAKAMLGQGKGRNTVHIDITYWTEEVS